MSSPDISAAGLVSLCAVFTGLSMVLTALRFYMRTRQKLPYLADDWLMLLSTVAFIPASICMWISVSIKSLGYSSHQFSSVQVAATAEESIKLKIAGTVFMIICLGSTKASALCFYKRIFFAPGVRAFKVIVISSLIVVGCWVVTFEFLNGFQCHTHFAALWNGQYDKYCTISWAYEYGWTISDVLLDAWTLALPIPMILRLHTSWRRKLCIVGAFCLGLAGLGASLARMVITIQIENMGPAQVHSSDEEHIDTKTEYFIMLEVGMSMIAINMTSLWPLFANFSPADTMRSLRSRASRSEGTSRSKSIPGEAKMSQDHHDTNTNGGSSWKHTNSDTSSGIDFLDNESANQTYAMGDIPRPRLPTYVQDNILVKDTVEVVYE